MRTGVRGAGAATVVLVGLDADALGLVRETLAAEAVLPSASVGFQEAIGVVQRTRPDVVIVSYSSGPEAALELGELLRKEPRQSTLIALAETSSADAILGAMRVGYKEFVVLPDDADRLRQVVHEAAYGGEEEGDKGMLVALTGAKGGVGTSIISTHLAAELAAIHRVLCIDLDFGMGDVASIFDLQARDSIAELLHDQETVTARALSETVVVHKSKVHVLPTPEEMETVGEFEPDDVYRVLSTAAQVYQFVLADCGAYYDEAVTTTLSAADLVLLVTTPDVSAVRDAFRRLKMLNTLGVEKDRIRLVVNRWSSSSVVTLENIRQNLGMPVSGTVSDDVNTASAVINQGRLAREVSAGSAMARDISSLVGVLTDDPEEIEARQRANASSSGGFLANLFKRG